jgi:di/tricarboxylate transporter
MGDINLRSGDTLLLQTNTDFEARWRNSPDFYLVSSVADSEPLTHEKLPIAVVIFVGMLLWLIVGSFFGNGQSWTSPAVIILVAVAGFLLTRCMKMNDARRAIDIQLLVTIACAIGLGSALEYSGAAKMVADTVVGQVGLNPWLLLIVVYILAAVLTEMITNTAVAALMFPIALNVALSAGFSPRPFIIAISLAASLAFITPIGYQTNLMVMGPGGYRPSDFVRMGLPLSVLVGATAILLIPFIWHF